MRTRLPLLAALLALPIAAAADALQVDVVSARSVGCSPDFVTDPDLRVRVFLGDRLVFETQEAQDEDEPLFANLSTHVVNLPVTLGIEVEEGEPGGFLGLGPTRWVPCDAAPGPDRRLNVTVDGATTRIVARGDDAQAAEAVVVVGLDAPAVPTLRVERVAETEAVLAWSGDAQATAHRLARGGHGGVLAVAGPGDATARLTDLCDNTAYAVRLVRDQGPWSVSSPDLVFRTANAPPPPPRVLSSERGENGTRVAWESDSAHDVETFEVHAGPDAGFMPSASTLRATAAPALFPPHEAEDVPLRAGDAFLRVRAVDTGGLASDSDALAVGARQSPTVQFTPTCARVEDATITGGGSPVTSSTTPPTRGTTTTTTHGDGQGREGQTPAPPGSGVASWGIVVAIALGAAALGGVLVLALRR